MTWEPREKKDLNALTGYGPGGIGLFGHGLLDTHFANRGRHGRLIQLLVDSSDVTRGAMRAFGVDENTALVVTGELFSAVSHRLEYATTKIERRHPLNAKKLPAIVASFLNRFIVLTTFLPIVPRSLECA